MIWGVEVRSAFGVRLRNPERVELPLSNVSWRAALTGWRKSLSSRLRTTRGMREPISMSKAVAALVPRCATALHMGGARSAFGKRRMWHGRFSLPCGVCSSAWGVRQKAAHLPNEPPADHCTLTSELYANALVLTCGSGGSAFHFFGWHGRSEGFFLGGFRRGCLAGVNALGLARAQ